MPQQGEIKLEDSLFSLELVVDKVYIPHTPCRFPAIAFRLLDFPTIVLKHVEEDLALAIRKKISFEPYYQLPDQFIEVKDKHGNFMVKKGKSCLFKISAQTLKQHLENTPLYVMLIDLFPEVPKLIGNSIVPLNSLMDCICADIAKLGSTVPSVHGDKGLFKIYNLMGKEIGYFVLGFRLLCLGPSLIPHLPESALMHLHLTGKQTKEAKRVDAMIKSHENLCREEQESDESLAEMRNSACMTDPIKQDVILQTVEVEDKAINVAIDSRAEDITFPDKEFQSMSTQTEKRNKNMKTEKVQQKWIHHIQMEMDEDEVTINNILCPPPLFYNSEASPSVKIERQQLRSPASDISDEDLSDIKSYDGYGFLTEKLANKVDQHQVINQPSVSTLQVRQDAITSKQIPQLREGETVWGMQVAPQPHAVFPLLTALINELSCIQNPQLLLQVSNQLQAASSKRPVESKSEAKIQQPTKQEDKFSPSVVSAVATALAKKIKQSEENKVNQNTKATQESHGSHTVVKFPKTDKKNNALKKSFPKKEKLVYGMTNTQRLRIQKANPHWLKTLEKEAADLKAQKHFHRKQIDVDDLNSAAFSDTLTEVRRLAEKELNSTAGGDTLHNVAREVKLLEPAAENKETEKDLSRRQRPDSQIVQNEKLKCLNDKSLKSFVQRSLQATSPPKSKFRKQDKKVSKQKQIMKNLPDSDEHVQRHPVPLEKHMSGITSPSFAGPAKNGYDNNDDQISTHSDMLNSQSHSIKVHIPSAEPDSDDVASLTDAEESDRNENYDVDDDDDIPLPDDSLPKEKPKIQVLNLPRYISEDSSLAETIHGSANASVNLSGVLDNNSPLESTRQSNNQTPDQNDSQVLQFTDYDTRQFQSTDEPELQGLISEGENLSENDNSGRKSVASVRTSQKFPVINPQLSENSPLPSVRRSTTKLDPIALNYLPSTSQTKGVASSPASSRTATPMEAKDITVKPLTSKSGSYTPRSTSSSPRRPTPRPRKPLRESIHTDSLSSYMPSDPDNVIVSLSTSNSAMYSDDFQSLRSGESAEGDSFMERAPKIIPNARLGYTIH